MRSDIRQMITDNKFCVLATVFEGAPHCSLMSYATDEECREIYMATLKDTKKYRNLAANPSVSLLIDSRNSGPEGQTQALTVTGVFQKAVSDRKEADIREALVRRHPELRDFFQNPDARVIVIRSTALQLLSGVTDIYFENVQ